MNLCQVGLAKKFILMKNYSSRLNFHLICLEGQMKKMKRRLIGFKSQMRIVYLNISKMKDPSLTKTLLL